MAECVLMGVLPVLGLTGWGRWWLKGAPACCERALLPESPCCLASTM